jgi:hypothetical protein
MRRALTARGLILAAVAMAITLALSLAVTAGNASSASAISRVPDSTTLGQLSSQGASGRIQATTAISDAAWLAGGLLASAIEVKVDLPLIER